LRDRGENRSEWGKEGGEEQSFRGKNSGVGLSKGDSVQSEAGGDESEVGKGGGGEEMSVQHGRGRRLEHSIAKRVFISSSKENHEKPWPEPGGKGRRCVAKEKVQLEEGKKSRDFRLGEGGKSS